MLRSAKVCMRNAQKATINSRFEDKKDKKAAHSTVLPL